MSDSNEPIRFNVPQRSRADRKKKLGKGLGALLGETNREEPLVRKSTMAEEKSSKEPGASGTTSPLANIAVAAISPLPGQPRRHFDDSALDELAASISARGMIQPVIVRPVGNRKFQLVAGERRWRAAQRAKLHEIPALIREIDDSDAMALALIENIQREDLSPVEEARAYQRLARDDGMTQRDIARLVEKSRSHVANLQRLLQLPEAVLEMVEKGSLSMGHARALIGHDDALGIAIQTVEQNLSVREVERLIRSKKPDKSNSSVKRSTRNPARDADIAAVQAHLEEFLGLKVRIKTDADPRSGAVTIRYRTLDQLDLICQRLTGGDI